MHLQLRGNQDCPAGASWYVCSFNAFQGCCHVNPCTESGCPNITSATTSWDISTDRPSTVSVATSTISIVINATARHEPALAAVSVPTVVGGVIGALLVGVLLGPGIVWLWGRRIRYLNRGVEKGSSEAYSAEALTNMELVRPRSILELEASGVQELECRQHREQLGSLRLPHTPPSQATLRHEACVTD